MSEAENTPPQSKIAPTEDEGGKWRMYFWPLMALLVIVAFFLRDRFGGPDGSDAAAVGKPLNQVQLIGLTEDATPISAADLKGKVTLINFWGYWCPPCVAELPELIELRDEFAADERFQFLSVACHGVPDKPDVLRAKTLQFLESNDYELTVHLDPQGATRLAAANANGAEWIGYPTTVLIDSEGVIRGFWSGYSPAVIRQQRSEIAKLL